MDDRAEPSPLKNLVGGGGCGCGCVGLILALGGGVLLATIPLGFYLDPSNGPWGLGMGLIAGGIVLFLLGAVVYVGSLFLD